MRGLVSVVVPTLDEEQALPALLQDLRELAQGRTWRSGDDPTRPPQPDIEVVVADGGSTDRTVAIAEAAGARVVHASRGRGHQLRAGAAAARGGWLLFLHADVRLPRSHGRVAFPVLEGTDRRVAWWFPLRIDAPGLAYRLIELGTSLRSRLLGLPYGDQGLLIHRALYDATGGYDAVPLMEDVILVRRLHRWGRLRALHLPLAVSARRWQRDGVLRRTLRNWGVLARWMLGASPESLARRYELPQG